MLGRQELALGKYIDFRGEEKIFLKDLEVFFVGLGHGFAQMQGPVLVA